MEKLLTYVKLKKKKKEYVEINELGYEYLNKIIERSLKFIMILIMEIT